MSLADIVNINITRASRAVSRAGFGTGLFLSLDAAFAEVTKVYSSYKAVSEDPEAGDDTKAMALSYFGQELKPKSLIVGKILKTGEEEEEVNDLELSISTAQESNDSWYKLIIASKAEADVKAAAAYIETQRKIFCVSLEDADILTGVDTDLASELKALGYVRSYVFFSEESEKFPEAAIEGLLCPKDPGSYTYKFKTIRGIAPSKLNDTQITNLRTKNVNFFHTVGGVNMFEEGTVIGEKEFIDTIIFIDWLHARMSERIFATLVSLDKVPFTDNGIGVIENDVRAQLTEGIRVGGLAADPAPVVTVPKASEVDPQEKLARKLGNVTFQATLAGAIHSVEVSGTVSV
jgi:hypothetical protein